MNKKLKAYSHSEKKNLTKKQRVARLIGRCFNEVNFDYNRFYTGEFQFKSPSGETKFYEASPIDRATRKLNRILRYMSK